MVKRNRLRNGRPQAAFGIDGAIMAAANIASAVMQAEATKAGAKEQAKSIQAQTENNTRLMEQQLDATKQEYEKNRSLQRNLQMNLQMMAGQQNVNEMKNAAKIQVKNGGSSRRKLRSAGGNTSKLSLRGNKIPGITTPNKGNYIPLAIIDNGILAEIVGPDHSKGGVDIDINGKPGVEAEGGELMHIKFGLGGLVNKNGIEDIHFLSKHTLPGTDLNPKKEVMSGRMSPDESFYTQEFDKRILGISDDGKHNRKSPIRSMRFNGGITSPNIIPDLSMDYVVPVATGIMSQLKDDNQARYGRSLKKCGGRKKALFGITKEMWDDDGARANFYGNAINGGVNALANEIGAAFSLASAKYAKDAMNNAINQMHGIDLSKIRREDYRSAHAMAALQDTNVNISPELAMLERDYNRQLTNINRNTLSSAAAIDRSTKAATNYYDLVNKLYGEARRIKEGRLAENARMLTQVANENANRDVQANNAYLQAYLHGMEYNANVKNKKEEMRGENEANFYMHKGNTLANMTNAIGQNLGTATKNAFDGFANTQSEHDKQAFELGLASIGASEEGLNRLNLLKNKLKDKYDWLFKFIG